MTLWAFVSDIHGNYAALRRAVAWCEDHGVERYVCLGDVIGRGDPDACVEWVREHTAIAIVGNRDLDYIDRVRPELQAVVRQWPNEGRASDFIVSHGDPKLHKRLNSSGVREDFRKATSYMEEAVARLWLFGHTHNARVWRLCDGASEFVAGREAGPSLPGAVSWRDWDGLTPSPLAGEGWGEGEITLDPESRYVVNVGTTGMPLPGKGPAAFATYDDQAKRLRVIPLAVCAPDGREPRS